MVERQFVVITLHQGFDRKGLFAWKHYSAQLVGAEWIDAALFDKGHAVCVPEEQLRRVELVVSERSRPALLH